MKLIEKQDNHTDLAINSKYCIELFSFGEYKERNSFPESKGLRHLSFAVNGAMDCIFLLRKNADFQDVKIDEIIFKK